MAFIGGKSNFFFNLNDFSNNANISECHGKDSALSHTSLFALWFPRSLEREMCLLQ